MRSYIVLQSLLIYCLIDLRVINAQLPPAEKDQINKDNRQANILDPINGTSSLLTTPLQPQIEVTTITPTTFVANTIANSNANPPESPRNDVNLAVIDYSARFINETLQFVDTNESLNKHHNNTELEQYLRNLHQKYPNVTRLYSIGESVNKRKLWVLELTENPGVHELLKPEFRYIANMHGNEVVGRELLLNFARLILENYSVQDPTDRTVSTGHKFAKKLLETTRIHLLPSLNPDGYELSDVGCKYEDKSLRGRVNANNVDLNRNFPDSTKRIPVTPATQPEVLAFMNWSHWEPFVLSANFHGGAEVVVYPYDGALNTSAKNESRLTPDDDIFKELATSYAFNHSHMHLGQPCYDKCTEYHKELFPNGTTNGAAWYSMYGSLQDWIYENTNELDLTIEVGCNQYPPANTLESYWNMNKVSMFNFLLQVHRGVKGTVRDSLSHEYLDNVTIHVLNRPNGGHNTTTTKYGDYFRLLAPGDYRILFEKPGYESAIIDVPSVKSIAQIHNIELRPLSGSIGANHLPTHSQAQSSSEMSHDDGGGGDHSIVVATLIMTIITVLILLLMAGAYVIQRRRLTRSQSMSVELQPRTSAGSTGISLGQQRSGSSTNTHLAA